VSKYTNSWKSRGTYGQILYRKIKRLNKKFIEQMDSDSPDHSLLFNYSKALDYSIQTQLSNITKVEEFDMSEIMMRYYEYKERVQEVPEGQREEGKLITR